jgi:hypothetical protein
MNKLLILMLSFFAFIGCGSSDSSGQDNIDISNYLPTTSMTKEYTSVSKVNGDIESNDYLDTITVESNLITMKKGSSVDSIITIKADEIEFKSINDINHTKVVQRHVAVDDAISNYIKESELKILKIGTQRIGEERRKVEEMCLLDSVVNKYEVFFYDYNNYDDNHDILKIKCVTKSVVETTVDAEYTDMVSYQNGTVESKDDISYLYLQKGLGVIATINDDCLSSKLPDIIDDTLDPSLCLGERYNYTLYHSQY